MKEAPDDESELLRSSAMQTSQSIAHLRHRADLELAQALRALELRTEELAHSLSVLRATLEATTDGILVVSDAGEITDFNQQFLDVWRVPGEVLLGKERVNLLANLAQQLVDPEEFLERTNMIYEECLPETTDRVCFQDGRVYERCSRLQKIGDRVVGRVWSYRDISEQVRAEETLRDEARILELLNKTGTAIAAQLDLRNIVQIVTDAGTELTGAKFGAFFYTKTDENGEALTLFTLSGAPREAFEKFGHPRATALFGPTFQGEGPIRSDNILQDARYGQFSPHHGMPQGHLPVRSYLAMPVISSSGEVIGGLFFGHPEIGVFTERAERIIVGVAAQAAIAIDNARLYEAAQREIEQRKRAEAEREKLLVSEKEARARAERETRMKDEFLATLSHELRTPLNAILGWANLLGATDRPEDVAEGVSVIERNARAQAQIIEDLLDMSRIISGKVRLEVQQVDLLQLIRSAVESVNPMATARQVALSTTLDPEAGAIRGDPARIQQVLWNLLTNAIKFTPKGGTVEVLLEQVESKVAIRVRDSGEGITPEFLPNVFDRFRQADASTTRQHGGLGLGLAIVKNLVELHGGGVTAESGGRNRGATFTVRFPLSAVQLEPEERARPRGGVLEEGAGFRRQDLRGVKILAVDDDVDARELLRRVLSECGAVVELASSAREALQALQTMKPDVLVSDVGMPGEDGYSLLQRVRALSAEEGGAIPAIALTAFARVEDRKRALGCGFQLHLAKPVESSELITAVANLAGRTPRG